MDSNQQLSKLDPKLREAYERVMGSAGTPAPAASGSTPPQPVTPSITAPTVASPPHPLTPSPVQPSISTAPKIVPTPAPVTLSPLAAAQAPSSPSVHPIPSSTPQAGAAHPEPEKVQLNTQMHGYVASKKKKGMSPVFLILGIVVFLIAYTIFWLKFFHVPLPFTIPFLP